MSWAEAPCWDESFKCVSGLVTGTPSTQQTDREWMTGWTSYTCGATYQCPISDKWPKGSIGDIYAQAILLQ